MTSDQDTFRTVGEAIFGINWQTPLSRALSVTDRTVRRWASGESPIPDGVWSELALICTLKGGALIGLAETLGMKAADLTAAPDGATS